MSKGNRNIDCKILADQLKAKRQKLGLSLRDVEYEIGVNASTLSRIENGRGTPDADNIRVLTDWLDIPIEMVMKSGSGQSESIVVYPNDSTPDAVAKQLRRDKTLSPKAAQALSELFRVAYTQMTEVQNEEGDL